jgi:hypothetical protein
MPDHIAGHPPYRNGYHALARPGPPPVPGPPPPPPPPRVPVPRPMPFPLPMPVLPPVPPLVPQPRRSGRATAATLAALACAFLVAAGVFMALLVAAGGDLAAENDRLDQRRGELTDLDGRVAAADAEQDRVERDNTALESANAELAPCVDAMRHYVFDNLGKAEREAALGQVLTFCR